MNSENLNSGDHLENGLDGLTKIEQEAAQRKLKLSKSREIVMNLIIQCARNGNKYLDLTRKNLTEIPKELLSIPHVEYLYLEGNDLKILPEDFFQKLPELRWLDLRNNKLISLPSAYIGSHQHLKYLLVQGNALKNLPLELGEVKSLQGLSITNNPLVFPAPEVVSKGLATIQEYLHAMLEAKSRSALGYQNGDRVTQQSYSNNVGYEDDSDEEETFGSRTSTKQRSRGLRPSSAKSDTSEVMGHPVSLHRQQSYQELKHDKMTKLKKVGAMGKLTKKPSQTKLKDVNVYPQPPSVDMIDQKVREQQLLAIKREKNEKIEVILQRRKDEDKLKKFRDDSTMLQRRKEHEKYMNGGTINFTEPSRAAPYDFDEEYLCVMSNEERIKNGVKENHERIRRVLSPRAIRELEKERAKQDIDLREKIKDHTQNMKTRRKKAKGTPQEEMSAAMKELEIAKRLQHELDRRRRDLDFKMKSYNQTT